MTHVNDLLFLISSFFDSKGPAFWPPFFSKVCNPTVLCARVRMYIAISKWTSRTELAQVYKNVCDFGFAWFLTFWMPIIIAGEVAENHLHLTGIAWKNRVWSHFKTVPACLNLISFTKIISIACVLLNHSLSFNSPPASSRIAKSTINLEKATAQVSRRHQGQPI